ncbi:unnamed protein product, partial [Allacma fusca]
MPTKGINSLLKAIPPNSSDSETSEAEVRSSKKNMKKSNPLPAAPAVPS